MKKELLRTGEGTSDEELLRTADLPSFAEGLHAGAVRWDLLHPFPEQSEGERAIGDSALAEVTGWIRERIDPVAVDVERRLPAGLFDELRTGAILKLGAPSDLGGLGLSPFNVFRVLSAVVSWSSGIGPVLTADNGLGVGAYLPALPPGPLRDWVRTRVAAGVVSCTADTEPTGAHNKRRVTTAVPTEDGSAYLITGEKIYVANAPVADVFVTTATVREPEGDQLRLFFVDSREPGIQVKAVHDFIGLGGFPNGNIQFDRVRVPRERVFIEERHEGRLTPATTRMVVRGRMYHVGAPSLAFARLALHCARDFCLRRTIDGRPLAGYEEVSRQLAASLADTFAISTLCEWSLLAEEGRPINPLYEQLAAKNIASVTCWRVVDRLMGLLGAEGLEIAASKIRRGAAPLPLERVLRDARIMRVTGGVDFQLDNWAGRHVLASYLAAERTGAAATRVDLTSLPDVKLSPRNLAHARRVEADAARLAEACREAVRRWPDQEALFERERLVILLSLLSNDILTMALVLARASRMTARGRQETQALADVYCTAAEHRIDDWQRQLSVELADDDAADHAGATGAWLHGDRLGFLTDDIVPPVRAR